MTLNPVEIQDTVPRQKFNGITGRVITTRTGWIVRILALVGVAGTISFNLIKGFDYHDPLIIYSTMMPIHAFLIMSVGWLFFKNAQPVQIHNELVSVIVPIYNQQSMIGTVIDAIFASSYKNIEVIAVNDGSKDKTIESLKILGTHYPTLVIIDKKNEGKRKAVAAGFYRAKGMYIVDIDSDSVVDKKAIEELMKVLLSDKKIGCVVGEAKVWNASKNFFTKFQDVWYDYAFNIHKTTESVFSTVLCCSGCLSAYRREAIESFIPYWSNATVQNSDDRDKTRYVIAPGWAKKQFTSEQDTILKMTACYDDADDRLKTGQCLDEFKSIYAPKAVVFTDVPETWRGYIKQQTRWKKGYIRSNFYVGTFFWKKHPLMALIFYTEFMAAFTSPLISLIVLFYEPFILGHYNITLIFVLGSLLTGLAQGMDYKCRVKDSKYWYYKPVMNLVTSFILSWLVVPAIIKIRKNEWLTR